MSRCHSQWLEGVADIRDRLNMRTAHGIYRSLQQFLEDADKNGFDEDIDMDFRSVCPIYVG